jgi:hypothetical protein
MAKTSTRPMVRIHDAETNEVIAIVKLKTNEESNWIIAASAYEFGILKEDAAWVNE